MKKIGKKELVLLVLAIIVFLSALGYFCYKEIPELIKPKVYYRTYTKEKGWSRWSKNGETSGNGYDITAVQIKLKNSKKTAIKYNALSKYNYDDKGKNNGDIAGNKKDSIKYFYIRFDNETEKKYSIKYRSTTNEEKWNDYDLDGTMSYVLDKKGSNSKPIKYIQIIVEERRK